jgi:hypothetical protein
MAFRPTLADGLALPDRIKIKKPTLLQLKKE